MLPRSSRLHRDRDIKAVLRRGRYYATAAVDIYMLPREQAGLSRVACVVGLRVSSSAVVRHRFQRRLRRVAQEMLETVLKRRAYDMVWVAKRPIAHYSPSQLRAAVTSVLRRVA